MIEPKAESWTVLDHCCRVERTRTNGLPVRSPYGLAALCCRLAAWGIPPEAPYSDWRTELCRRSAGRYPVEDR